MYQRLREILPHRQRDILCIPYGVEIPRSRTHGRSATLRLLYVGRLDRSKGIFDLPEIDRLLRARQISTEWTIHGPGPAERELRAAWGAAPNVTWSGRSTMDRVKQLYLEHDVLVMPSRTEGLPVALLEGMAHGCIPVVSDLPSGIPELVENGVNGFRIPPGNVAGFADAIALLASGKRALSAMSDEAAARVKLKFNIAERAPQYQRVIAAAAKLTPRWSRARVFQGSRLDKPWIPNLVVTGARSLRRAMSEFSSPSIAPDDDQRKHGGLR
jgi:glycosyltransferase involved in cell wall biosynthesis